jgi:hypothetical protein
MVFLFFAGAEGIGMIIHANVSQTFFWIIAGAEGIEPSTAVLETAVIPLN